MKILMIFFDMFRTNLTNLYDERNEETEFDRQIRKMGGVFFENCFTPAPDTPRSNGCLWTSLYPSENGCDNRLKYPKHFIKPGCKDFLQILKENGYSFNFFIAGAMQRLGELPASVSDTGNYSNDRTLQDYLNTLKIQENSLTYLGFNDYHQIVTDTYAQGKYARQACRITGEILDEIFSRIPIDTFDLIFVYSDHGFKKREENFPSAYQSLDRSRTQILLFVHKKGDLTLSKSKRLSSIMDIYPTIIDECGIKYENAIRGRNLFSSPSPEYLMIEDHKYFTNELGQTIERWAIRNEKGYAATDAALNWEADYELTEEDKKSYEKILATLGTDFLENTKMKKIKGLYEAFLLDCPTHYDGSPRIIRKPFSQKARDAKHKIEQAVEKSIKFLLYFTHKGR